MKVVNNPDWLDGKFAVKGNQLYQNQCGEWEPLRLLPNHIVNWLDGMSYTRLCGVMKDYDLEQADRPERPYVKDKWTN